MHHAIKASRRHCGSYSELGGSKRGYVGARPSPSAPRAGYRKTEPALQLRGNLLSDKTRVSPVNIVGEAVSQIDECVGCPTELNRDLLHRIDVVYLSV